MVTEDKSSQSFDLKKLVSTQRHWFGVRGYVKITEEYDDDGLSKVTREHQPGRTLWDWVQLLIIPFVIGAGAIWFNMQQSQTSLQVSQAQHKSDQMIAVDQQRATTLQMYIDNIQDLLLNHNLLKSKPTDNVAILARARTLTALEGLDPHRKGVLLKFLYEARLIGFYDPVSGKNSDPILGLSDADLSGADLGATYPRPPGLCDNKDCFEVHLSGAYLFGADLSYANLSGANLSGADLLKSNLFVANLSGTDLSGADLFNARLFRANLSGANLSGAWLQAADLGRTNITQQQLDQADSCKDAFLNEGLTCHHQ